MWSIGAVEMRGRLCLRGPDAVIPGRPQRSDSGASPMHGFQGIPAPAVWRLEIDTAG